jgi:hypothetical protein
MPYKPAHQSPMEMRGYTPALTQALRVADYLGWPIKLGHQGNFHFNGFILRDARLWRAPQDEVSDPHGEERVFARLEP